MIQRVGLCGPHGGGKTTLAKLLAQRLGVEVIDVSRPTTAAKNLGYDKASDVPASEMQLFQWMGLFEQIHQERLRIERPGEVPNQYHFSDGSTSVPKVYESGFVADRTVVDFAAYYTMQVESHAQVAEYRDLIARHARKAYDAILYVPVNAKGVEDDGRRHTSDPTELDAVMRHLLKVMDLSS